MNKNGNGTKSNLAVRAANETKMKEFVVTFKSSYQISPDDFKVYNPSMKVTEATTVKEIADFFCKHVKGTPVEVTLIELEQLRCD
jgi:hypothetical protein